MNSAFLNIYSFSFSVRTTFCNRVGLPVDEDGEDSEEEKDAEKTRASNVFGESSLIGDRSQLVLLGDSTEPMPSGTKPKKFKKKKGGHLDTKRRRR